MHSITPKPNPDKRPAPVNRTRPIAYGEIHLMMGVRETLVDLHVTPDGSGTFKVLRAGIEVVQVEWPAEQGTVGFGLSSQEKDRV